MTRHNNKSMSNSAAWIFCVSITAILLKSIGDDVLGWAFIVAFFVGVVWLYLKLRKSQRITFGSKRPHLRYVRQSIPVSVRTKVLNRDKSTCQLCGSKAPHVTLHIDHIKPVSKGGTNVISNLQVLCDRCNLGKSNRFVLWFNRR